MKFIEEEAWDGSIEKTMNVKSYLSRDEDEEDVVEINNPSIAQPPPTQGQQGTPQAAARTPLRRSRSTSPSTPRGAEFSASSSTSTPSERGTKFGSVREIYEQGAANEGMNSLFALYCQVDDPTNFEDGIKDRKWIEAMDYEINSI